MKPILVLLFAVLFLTGCKTADLAQTGQMASLEITGHSEVEIIRAIQAVFANEGYDHTHDLVFDKKGSVWDKAAYGDLNTDSTWIRAKVTIDPLPTDGYVIGFNLYMVNNHNEGVVETEQKISYAKRSECKVIVNEIKAQLDPGTATPDKQ